MKKYTITLLAIISVFILIAQEKNSTDTIYMEGFDIAIPKRINENFMYLSCEYLNYKLEETFNIDSVELCNVYIVELKENNKTTENEKAWIKYGINEKKGLQSKTRIMTIVKTGENEWHKTSYSLNGHEIESYYFKIKDQEKKYFDEFKGKIGSIYNKFPTTVYYGRYYYTEEIRKK